MFSCTNTLHDHNVCFISGQMNCIHFIPLHNVFAQNAEKYSKAVKQFDSFENDVILASSLKIGKLI